MNVFAAKSEPGGWPRLAAALASCLLLWLAAPSIRAAGWQPAPAPLATRWAKEVSPSNALPEYPRPTMARPQWLNLNGLWDYVIQGVDDSLPSRFSGQILVPFPLESSLSGVRRPLDETQVLWYRRHFTLPAAWAGQRVRLHLGAADWKATVYVNGRLLGTHRGGYDAFEFDITPALATQNPQELLVAVWDPTEGEQPRGKQSRKPEGIFYTSTSGLWQTVWLEPVPATCVESLRIVPDIDLSRALITAYLSGSATNGLIRVQAYSNSVLVAEAQGAPNTPVALKLPSPRLWSPVDPFLYQLQITLQIGGQKVDAVASYLGMRKIAASATTNGPPLLLLNNRPLFQWGVLDQGFWPDGIYTAPTDAALRFDLESLKSMGFNMARKHVKVEPERWYYWCDRLGILVWQDMPSGNNLSEESRRQFETELQRLIIGHRNHPSIITWVIFNEGWGQYDTERLVRLAQAIDPSRLVDSASGWTDVGVGDVIDSHEYPGPGSPVVSPPRATVLGEFGGLELPVEGHTWSITSWGYVRMADSTRLERRFYQLCAAVRNLQSTRGLGAAVYTQISDVETECNGLLTYDRAHCKLAPGDARNCLEGKWTWSMNSFLLPTAQQSPSLWRYTTATPAPGWQMPGADLSTWSTGLSGFGTDNTPGALAHTVWDTSDIWLVREFTLAAAPEHPPVLWMHHDETVEVYLNGVEACRAKNFTIDYEDFAISPESAATLKAGTNTIAIHCHQTIGGQYIDAGLASW